MTLLTNEDLDRLAVDIPYVKAWLKAVEDEIKEAIEAGAEFENVSIVPTQAQRKWIEDIDPIKILRKFSKLDVVAPRKVLSPAQAEKALGGPTYREKVAKFVEKRSSGTKLAYRSETED